MAHVQDTTAPSPAGTAHLAHPNPYRDVPSWWRYFFSGGYSWQWWSSPHLYFPPGLVYRRTEQPFVVPDAMGRETTHRAPFEGYPDPESGKIRELYVQAPESLCRLAVPNATWNRTPIRNATSFWVRIADMRYAAVPAQRRYDSSMFTGWDYVAVFVMWLASVVVFLFSVS